GSEDRHARGAPYGDGGVEVAVGEHGLDRHCVGSVVGDQIAEVGVEHREALSYRLLHGGADHACGHRLRRVGPLHQSVAGDGEPGVYAEDEHLMPSTNMCSTP